MAQCQDGCCMHGSMCTKEQSHVPRQSVFDIYLHTWNIAVVNNVTIFGRPYIRTNFIALPHHHSTLYKLWSCFPYLHSSRFLCMKLAIFNSRDWCTQYDGLLASGSCRQRFSPVAALLLELAGAVGMQ